MSVAAPDYWRIPTFLLWSLFMVIGLLPDAAFYLLQSAAGVTRYEALVGSPLVLTVAFSGYFSAFVYSESIRGGAPQHMALANAVQTGSVGLIAFLPVTVESIQFAVEMRYYNLLYVSFIVLTAASVKLMAWGYLLSFVVRYYLFGHQEVFAGMASFFPSARHLRENGHEPMAGAESTIHEQQSFEHQEGARRISD